MLVLRNKEYKNEIYKISFPCKSNIIGIRIKREAITDIIKDNI